MAKMTWLDQIANVLLLAGGLNWGAIAAFNMNLVEKFLPSMSNIVYLLVGVSAVYIAYRGYVQKFN